MKPKWQPIVKINGSLLFNWYWMEGGMKFSSSSLGIDFNYKHNKIVVGEISIDLNEAVEVEKKLTEKLRKEANYLQKYIDRCYQYSNKLISLSKRLGKTPNLQRLSESKLLALYKNYQEAVLRLMPFLNTILVVDEILKKEITQLLEAELGIKNKSKQEVVISKLIIPKKKSFFVEEIESLLKIVLKLQKNKRYNISKDVKAHLKKFAWSSSVAYLGEFQNEREVLTRVKKLIQENPREKLKERKQIRSKTLADYSEALSQIQKSKPLIKLVNFAQEFIYLQTYRLDVFFVAHYYFYPLLEEIASRFQITVEQLVYLTGDEITSLLKRDLDIDTEEIKKRQSNYGLILEKGEYTLISGDEVKSATKIKVRDTLVKGTIANRGRAKGRVKVIFEVEDIDKVHEGNIIVSPMTRPEFTPALIKASGIITDFGGMLSHAAIISREFGIPCIVGTNNATQVFKDGDKVELNAYEGVARKV